MFKVTQEKYNGSPDFGTNDFMILAEKLGGIITTSRHGYANLVYRDNAFSLQKDRTKMRLRLYDHGIDRAFYELSDRQIDNLRKQLDEKILIKEKQNIKQAKLEEIRSQLYDRSILIDNYDNTLKVNDSNFQFDFDYKCHDSLHINYLNFYYERGTQQIDNYFQNIKKDFIEKVEQMEKDRLILIENDALIKEYIKTLENK